MEIKQFQELKTTELYDILSLRNEIFVVEQNCIYQDIDYVDQLSNHIFIKDGEKIIAYARLIKPNVIYNNSLAIGRVMVKKEYRHKGLAKKLMVFVIEQAKIKYPLTSITISAQSYLIDFYRSLGFISASGEYLEDGIPHVKMILTN